MLAPRGRVGKIADNLGETRIYLLNPCIKHHTIATTHAIIMSKFGIAGWLESLYSRHASLGGL